MSLDLTGIENEEAWGTSAILPPGRHTVRFTEVRASTTDNGNPQLELRMEAFTGPYAGFGIGNKQVVTSGSLGKVRQIIEAAGIDVHGMKDFDETQLMGKTVTIIVGQEPGYKDPTKMFSVVTGYMPADDNGGVPVTSHTADADIPF